MKRQFWIYILLCKNGALYTGMTTDISKRYLQHLDGSGRCKYTRANPPVKLAQCWSLIGTRSEALKVEKQIKKISRRKKELLLASPHLLSSLLYDALQQNIPVEPCDLHFIEAKIKAGFPVTAIDKP